MESIILVCNFINLDTPLGFDLRSFESVTFFLLKTFISATLLSFEVAYVSILSFIWGQALASGYIQHLALAFTVECGRILDCHTKLGSFFFLSMQQINMCGSE